MKVCVTEKPSVARDIAKIIGATHRHEGYYEGNGYQVTWTFGHLCELKAPQDYTDAWKRWSLSALPMIPPRFGIKLKEDEGVKKQFQIIESLIASADAVINCGDAGQEGELIQRWVYQKAKCNKPISRLWISSLTDESIKQGFQDLKPSSQFDNLYYAGLSRAIGDWLLGMNASRLYTLKYAQGASSVLSIGRVQTPTLALIVKRQLEIDNFNPQKFWELKTDYRSVIFSSTNGRFKNQEEATHVLEQIKDKPLLITDIQSKKGKETPPRLFDLTSLQVECNKKFSLSAEETLNLAQSLYEKKLITYPRVDTTYLTDDIYPHVRSIMQAMQPYTNQVAPVLKLAKIPKSKKVFANNKVTDHHAIIPTNVNPTKTSLTLVEKRVYHLIALRFIAAFYPDCTFTSNTVMAKVDSFGFKAIGKQIIEPGWRTLYPKQSTNSDADSTQNSSDQENILLNEFVVGESGPHHPSIVQKQTQPPKPYTEGTLLRAMETAGKTIEDEHLRDLMKENGIGRPSTRAAIIETLFRRQYIRKQRKNLYPTPKGMQLIATIQDPLLKSPELTGQWENKLRRIERGELQPQTFIDQLKAMIHQTVIQVLKDNTSPTIQLDQHHTLQP